jgi:DHA1 family multidrug resistance protein-like MFS transporter
MLIPFLPMYLTRELGCTPADVNMWSGLVFSSCFAITAIMTPIWGSLADKKGKRLMAMRASFLLAISYCLGGLVQTPLQLTFMRVFQGFACGLWPMELAIMTIYAPPKKLGLCLGVMQGGLTAGGVIGPLFGGILAEVFGMRMSFFLAAAALFANFLVLTFCIKEPPNSLAVPSDTGTGIQEPSLWRNPLIRNLLIYSVFTSMVILLIQPILTTYITELSGGMDNLVLVSGFIFSLGGFASAITAPLWGQFGQHHGFHKSLTYALIAAAICSFMQALPNTLYYFAACQFAVGLFFSGINPSINAILAENTDAHTKGRVFGLLFSAQQIGAMIGPLLGGAIATLLGIKYVFIAAGIILTSISIVVQKRKQGE